MDQVYQEAAKQIPNMVVLAAVVVVFLKHLAVKDKAIMRIEEDCHRIADHANEAAVAAARSVEKIAAAVDRLVERVERIV